MRWVRLLIVLGQIASLAARTLPLRRFEYNTVPLAIAQDGEGVFWMATPGSVLRFDGLRFEPVHPPPGIDLSKAEQVAASADGSIWIGTQSGLIRHRQGSFIRELEGKIDALTVTAAGRILVKSKDHLLIALQPNEHPVRWKRIDGVTVHGRFQNDLEGNTWFGCGIYVCAWPDSDVEKVAAGVNANKTRRLPSAPGAEMADGKQWDWTDAVSTPDHRVWGRNGPNVIQLADGRLASSTVLPVETFQGIRPGFFLDRSGHLWIPGRTLHVVVNGELKRFEAADATLDNVTFVFQDRRGTLWFGLPGKGLAALPDEAELQSWSEPEGIAGSVLDLAFTPGHGFMAATNSGAYMLDADRARWRELAAPGEHPALRALVADGANSILFVPYNGGVFRSSSPFLSARELAIRPDVNRRRMRRLYRGPHGDLWVGSTEGLFRIGPANSIRRIPLPQAATYASDLDTGADGRVWVGYEGGVATCAADSCTQAIAPEDGLLSPKIRSIVPGPDEVWVAYRPGIGFSRFVRKAGGWTVTHFTPQDGYGPPDTHFVRRDHRGWIWRGSTDGVYVSDGKHSEPEDWLHLTFGDDVNASYANMYGFLEQPDGSVWIGTQKGVVRLDPSGDWFRTTPPRVSVSSIPQARRTRHEMEFHLARPGLPPFQSRLFRYRLLPADDRWQVTSEGTVRYSKLPPGSYKFEVAGGGGRPAAEYAFQVESEFQLPPSFWIALALVTMGGAAWLFARRRRSMQQAGIADAYWREKRRFLEERAAADGDGATPEDWSGRLLDDRFQLESCIASGGFASVYRAADRAHNDEHVAVKLLHPLCDNEDWRRRRFEEEVAALRTLHDAGVVEIRYSGHAALNRPYLVMEYIDGITLRALLREGPVEFQRAARLLRQIGRALTAAHRANILHRDLKPENVMVCAAGEPDERIKLIDFGIASALDEQSREHTTRLAGSPGYLAPERWVGLASCRSDIYSMAAIAAEMLSGVTVSELGSCAGDPRAFRHRMQTVRPGIPGNVIELLMAAMAYDPEARPGNAEMFAIDVSNGLLDSTGTPGSTPVSKHK